MKTLNLEVKERPLRLGGCQRKEPDEICVAVDDVTRSNKEVLRTTAAILQVIIAIVAFKIPLEVATDSGAIYPSCRPNSNLSFAFLHFRVIDGLGFVHQLPSSS